MTGTRLRSPRLTMMAETADGHASAASRGAHTSRRPYSPGARTDGFGASYPPFTGGTAVGQWRPIPPASAMSAQGLAFTAPFVVESNTQFRPDPPRTLGVLTYTQNCNAVMALGRRTGSTRTEAQTALAPFCGGQRQRRSDQAANQIARAKHLSMSRSNRLLAVLNLAMADTSFTIWSAKRLWRRSGRGRPGGR